MTFKSEAGPIGVFNHAHSYWGAGKAPMKMDWVENETHPHDPAEFMFWHAIELFLKAYLLADGVSQAELRARSFGHNLTALSKEAIKRGLPLSSKDVDLLSFMPTTADMLELRYLTLGSKTVPEQFELEDGCARLYLIVGREIASRGQSMGFHSANLRG